jgi:hypothetical protein
MGLTSVALAAVAVVEAATGLACVSFPQRLGADAAAASLSLLAQIGALRIAYAAMLGIAVFSLSASLSLLATAVLVHECLLTQVALSKQPMFKGKVWLSLLLGFGVLLGMLHDAGAVGAALPSVFVGSPLLMVSALVLLTGVAIASYNVFAKPTDSDESHSGELGSGTPFLAMSSHHQLSPASKKLLA